MTQEEFVELCVNGNYEQVCDAIRSGIDPNIEGKFGNVSILPISTAASFGNQDTVRALAESGANCADGFTSATIKHEMAIVSLLVKCGADINALDRSGHNALITAATLNSPDSLEEIISLGADVNAKSDAGYTALTYAAMMSSSPDNCKFSPRIVSLLMDNGADYYAAMMLAINTGNSEFIRLLLENGADPDISDAKGRTPLMIAATDEEVDPEVIDILLEFGADIDAADNKGLTALMWAVAGVDKIPNFMIPALIRTGGIRAKGWEKWCAFVSLYNSAKHELQIDAVKRLLERGADVNIFDKRGMNAMMYAIANDDYETADMLSDAGAQIIFDLT